MKSDELRQVFLDYFRDRGHTVVPSSSLVPEGDPTLLFTTAGMVQFKPYYASAGAIPFTRAASVQKCLRASDLEQVGRTIKHQTFFEMLGNFSFGDYFKEDAIKWGWDFLTRVIGLPAERLHVSVFEDDAESEGIWMRLIGVPAGRISRLGKEHNFWGPAGKTGPCGPCSEMHYDRGAEFGCRRADCSPACSCDRFVEVWNLVFPQFFMDEEGALLPLARKGVDTGMGLERLSLVSQGKASNFDTDLFRPIVGFIRDQAKCDSFDAARETSVRVIADHARALAFAISEGVLPSNEGRGYLIRRLLRRAVVKAMDIGVQEAFIFRVAGAVIDVMHGVYPELAERRENIAIVIRTDEERFERTLSRGMAIFSDIAARSEGKGEHVIQGRDVFALYDTYGFPVEITQEIAETRGLKVDLEGFAREMDEQRERARQSSKIGKDVDADGAAAHAVESFVGYRVLESPTAITALAMDGAGVSRVAAGDEAEVQLERTPFYPAGGGQVGDIGVLIGPHGRGSVHDVRWGAGGKISHGVTVDSGSLAAGEGVIAKVDPEMRKASQRNHTATHLLHAALRAVLGGHVRQSGSLVAPERLRFDFTHYEPVGADEIVAIEDMVNRKIMDNIPVSIAVEEFEKARARGAMALFGEKYGERVRVVEIAGTSCELCGGTHVASTGDIGSFRVVWESGIAAGVRRIEAVTGSAAVEMAREAAGRLESVASVLKVPVRDLEDGAAKLVETSRNLEKEVTELRMRLASQEVAEMAGRAEDVGGIRLVAASVQARDMEILKVMADKLQESLGDGVVCLGARIDDRAAIVVSAGPGAVARGVKASLIAKKLGEAVGGRGGGRDGFAQAGGKSPDMLEGALERCRQVIADLVR